MISKAIKLEWLKFRRYTPFAIIIALFIFTYLATGLSLKSLVDWFLSEQGNEFSFFKDTGLPVFDFVDIWQNLAYITFLFKVILAFVVIISVDIEYGSKTIKQNFIDGLSRSSYVVSKLSLITVLSLLAGFLLTLLGLILGLLYSPVKSLDFIFMNFEFVFAYILEVFSFLSLAMLFAVLIRRTGFAIVLFVLYAVCIEPIAAQVMYYEFKLPVWYLPVKSINNLIRLPFGKYIFREVQDYIAIKDVFVALGWTAIYIGCSYFLIKKRDV